ncbi:MAG: nucleotidyltransferase family protein [Acidimicrobiales bacterium]
MTEQRNTIIELCQRFEVSTLALYGSATTSDFDPDRSDVDFLVEFDPAGGLSRFDAYFGLREGLEKLLGCPVDLVTPTALKNPYFARSVKRTRKVLYAA